jgi:hypothetical protein
VVPQPVAPGEAGLMLFPYTEVLLFDEYGNAETGIGAAHVAPSGVVGNKNGPTCSELEAVHMART